jgi:D-alanyl-D-alanine carboxypeptidase
MRAIVISTVVAVAFVVAVGARAEPRLPEKVQAALESWLTERAPVEKATGIAAYATFGDPGPAIEVFAGKVGRAQTDAPVSQDTLFQMASTSKSFAAAVILKLEATGKLSLEDTVGRWLPEYPAWKDVSIRHLLNMSSGIPNYSETEAMSRTWAEEPNRTLSAQDLVKLAYPSVTNKLAPTTGYYYSNTNYILAGMIAAKAAGKPYRDLVHELLLKPLGLNSTFYEDGPYPAEVITRLAHGYFENPACTDYQPKECKVSWNQPILGRDMRTASTTWAQAAGGAISNARDLDRWMRAVFAGRVVPPKQQAEWLSLISLKTGAPIRDVSPADPAGFSLGLARAIHGPAGPLWFYEGVTLGYRTIYVWYSDENMMITLQTNSQQPQGMDKIGDAIAAVHDILKADPQKKASP